MPRSPDAFVTPAALRWARESIGFELEEAASRLAVSPAKLEKAESGDEYLTLRQAETAARVYERPLAALFLPQPPVEEAPETQFRRLPGAPEPPWPRQMLALVRRVRGRQEAASELYELLEEQPQWLGLDLVFEEDTDRFAASVRQRLGIELAEQKSWRDPSGYQPLRQWIDAVEALGVLVMQDGSLPVDEMRGFASTHPAVPGVIVNTNDDPRARAFTVIHELGHLFRTRANRQAGRAVEDWCNQFAAAVLMPADSFGDDFGRRSERDLLARVDGLALDYGVTPYAAAVRVARLNLAPRQETDAVIVRIRERARQRAAQDEGGGGGNYYSTMIGRLGPNFVQLVFTALDTQAVTYPVAAGLLGVKVNNFAKLRERAAERGR